jgi:hypothetical protein
MIIFWTLQFVDQPNEANFGTERDFVRWLRAKKLPHSAGEDNWVTNLLGCRHPNGITTFTQRYQGEAVWTLTWSEMSADVARQLH